ncbi:hypothetical protein STXM2123_5704 [Streptomyces sp. F-3]|nr:hypothetical protein STXM2123_5704 [Streptomyces sp. F-3]
MTAARHRDDRTPRGTPTVRGLLAGRPMPHHRNEDTHGSSGTAWRER